MVSSNVKNTVFMQIPVNGLKLKTPTVILQSDVENIFVPEIEGCHVLEEQIIW